MKRKVLIIIPAYNEQDNILKTYNSIIHYNKKNNVNYDVIIINDGSTDNTQLILEKYKIPNIQLIHNLGIGGAVQTGYKYAFENNYDVAVQFDGDGQHNIEYVKYLIESISHNNNLVIGSRFIGEKSNFKSSKMRRAGIKTISFFIKIFTSKKIYDTTSGFRACDKKIIKIFTDKYPTEYPEPISTVEIIKMGYNVDEVAVKMNERNAGVSSIRSWKSIYYMVNVILSIIIVNLRRYK